MGPAYEQIDSVEELIAIAHAMERDSADRYRGLAARLRAQGDAVVAAEFDALAELEERHVEAIAARAAAMFAPTAAKASPRLPLPTPFDAEEARGAALSPYNALAFAVRNEERAFTFYTYIAAAADNQAVRALAEDLARDELDHASRLRRLRRRAFHHNRPIPFALPGDVGELAALVGRWEKSASRAHAILAERLEKAGRADEAGRFRKLADEEAAGADGPSDVEAPSLASVAEGLLILETNFDRLAWIGERAKDEQVVAEAQRLAERMIARIALVGEP